MIYRDLKINNSFVIVKIKKITFFWHKYGLWRTPEKKIKNIRKSAMNSCLKTNKKHTLKIWLLKNINGNVSLHI